MQHVILIGFKSVGKSLIGENLAIKLNQSFVDSDRVLEDLYARERETCLSCREIMRTEGEEFFRALEHEALKKVLAETEQTIIAVGGGAPLHDKNAELFKSHKVVHLTAPEGVVYERIMVNGWPAFFPREVDPYISFQNLWQKRLPGYERLAHVTIENNAPIEDTVNKLIAILNNESI